MTKHTYFLIGLGVFCLIIVMTSFSIIGTPGLQKAVNLDRRRMADFSTFKYSIENYYRSNRRLPNSLGELPSTNRPIPTDPETKQPYEYKQKSFSSYSFCTTFSANSTDANDEYGADYIRYDGEDNALTYSKGYDCVTYSLPTYLLSPTPTPYIYQPYKPTFPTRTPSFPPKSTMTPIPY